MTQHTHPCAATNKYLSPIKALLSCFHCLLAKRHRLRKLRLSSECSDIVPLAWLPDLILDAANAQKGYIHFHALSWKSRQERNRQAEKLAHCQFFCLLYPRRYAILRRGEMSEWSKVPLSKSGRVQALVGSNPTLSAIPEESHSGLVSTTGNRVR